MRVAVRPVTGMTLIGRRTGTSRETAAMVAGLAAQETEAVATAARASGPESVQRVSTG